MLERTRREAGPLGVAAVALLVPQGGSAAAKSELAAAIPATATSQETAPVLTIAANGACHS